jgi:DNA-binding TFAR19-related protein (PDSD5 family)
MSIDPSQLKAQAEEQMTQEKQLAEAKKRRNIALTGLLTPEARERLDRLALVYPHKADAVTDLILQRADSGFVSQRVNEDQLKRMLDEVRLRLGPVPISRTTQTAVLTSPLFASVFAYSSLLGEHG